MSLEAVATPQQTDDAEVWLEFRRVCGTGAVRMLLVYLRELKAEHGSGSPGLVCHASGGNVVKVEVVRGRTVRAWVPER